jgi:hypothetical protein
MRDGNWLNAPSGLLRRDLSPKPAYEEIKRLVQKEWGFPLRELKADAAGTIRINGPEGMYGIKAGDKECSVVLEKPKKEAVCN